MFVALLALGSACGDSDDTPADLGACVPRSCSSTPSLCGESDDGCGGALRCAPCADAGADPGNDAGPGADAAGSDATGLDATGPDATGPDATGPDAEGSDGQTDAAVDAGVDVCNGLVTDKLAHPMTALTRPTLGQTVTDPEFGTTIRRITDVRNDGRGSNSVLKPVYSTVSAWNADESYLILYRTVGSGGGHELFNGKTYAFIRKLDDIDPADLEQIYWHTQNPDLLYYVDISSRRLIRYHISTRVKDTVHDFAGICPGGLTGGTDPMFTSWDSGKIGLVCPDSNRIFSYNIATNTVNRQLTLATGDNAPQAGPSGTRYFLNENDGRGTVRDDDMNVLLVLDMATAQEHGAMSMLANGQDTMNAVAFDTGPNGSGVGTLVQHNMVTGAARVIVGPATGYPYPPGGTHISGMAFKRPGLMAVSIMGNMNGARLLDSELLLVDTDPASNPTGKVCRIGHHRTASADYWAEPHVVISPSGTRVLYGSSWGNTGVIVDSYVVELPTYTP